MNYYIEIRLAEERLAELRREARKHALIGECLRNRAVAGNHDVRARGRIWSWMHNRIRFRHQPRAHETPAEG